jgi:hypothetical protein
VGTSSSWIKKRVMTWDEIRSFGESRLFRSASFVLFAVPACAKVLAMVPKTVHLTQFVPPVELHLRLPFNWLLLFWSACFATVGNVIYWFACPRLIKEYKDWQAFESAARDGMDLLEEVERIVPDPPVQFRIPRTGPDDELGANEADRRELEQTQWKLMISKITSLGLEIPNGMRIDDVCQAMWSPLGGSVSWAFKSLRDRENQFFPRWRLLASIAYMFAIVSVGWILCENVWAVITFAWHGQFGDQD